MAKTWQKDKYVITTDKTKLDQPLIHHFLSNSYWAQGRTLEQVAVAIEHSFCFGLFIQDQQIGFARVITDYSTFAYLADVFILPGHQGAGLGKWLLDTILNTPALNNVVSWLLLTKDAHQLYEQAGFQLFPYPERLMIKKKGGYQ